MYSLIEYGDAYSNTSGTVQQYYRGEPAIADNGNIIDFSAHDKSMLYSSLNSK